jgi:NADH:ubiquinone oxidoreductase subunit 5 (subunit L)/multisubunit Na+/H+ antiporter MnhA subunit
MLKLVVWIYILPIISCLILCLPYRFREKTVTRITGLSLLLPALFSFFLILYKGHLGKLPLEHHVMSLVIFEHVFDLIIWVDFNSIIMMTLTHLLGLLVVKYSHGYLHLEKGYQRFFSTILFFIFGMYVLSLAGTLDMFFAGWEIVGFSSFFLIAFYRSHTRTVMNAWRVYNIYRVCDVGILLGAVLGHVLWHEATNFSEIMQISNTTFINTPKLYIVILGFFLVLASVGKSAQFPFHTWPSKAMEGPTPSSAIFYGALSIHAGVFLLVRTFPIWSISNEIIILVMMIGVITFILSTLQGRVQANIKGQIAFASTAQIGIMFIELSFGLTKIAMVHLFLHALYRCFQLLVSPSIVANALTLNNKVMLDRISKGKEWELRFLPKKLNATLYTLALNDFSMDPSWRGFGLIPWRKAYMILRSILAKPVFIIPCFFLLLLPDFELHRWPLILSSISLYYSMRALFFQIDAFHSMIDLSISLFMDMLSVFLVDSHSALGIQIFLMSVIPAQLLGLYISSHYRHLSLHDFHAMGTEHTLHANLFLIVFMILAGMPISTAFFGEDIILEELINHSLFMAVATTLSLMMNGLICVRIYTRIFMGSRSLIHSKLK